MNTKKKETEKLHHMPNKCLERTSQDWSLACKCSARPSNLPPALQQSAALQHWPVYGWKKFWTYGLGMDTWKNTKHTLNTSKMHAGTSCRRCRSAMQSRSPKSSGPTLPWACFDCLLQLQWSKTSKKRSYKNRKDQKLELAKIEKNFN